MTSPDPAARPVDRPDVPSNPDALHAWIKSNLRVDVARTPIDQLHQAPFDYLCHTFFEGTLPARSSDPHPPTPAHDALDPSPVHPVTSPDCTVWANRGGGKTYLGAIATLLDLVFKRGIQVRILGGSLEQSQRMHEHLRRLFANDSVRDLLQREPTARRIELKNTSCVEVLAASQTSVRGTRVQKLRCDEVDLFDPDVWEAAQLTTRSLNVGGPWGSRVRGSIEALSTMHRPYGLMWNLVLGHRARLDPVSGPQLSPSPTLPLQSSPPHPSTPSPRQLFRWGLLDVLEHCGPEHTCGTCVLLPECDGRAKSRPPSAGHISVADAVSMKSRVDHATWDAEMLCNRPRRTECVYPEFDPRTHVYQTDAAPPGGRAFYAGMDFGFRNLTVILLASLDAAGILRIEREHAAAGLALEEHIAVLHQWIESGHAPDGLAWIGADPSGRQKDTTSGKSCFELLAQAGFTPRSRSGQINDGIRLVRARLRPASWRPALATTPLTINRLPRTPEPDARAPSTRPRLYIHARCTTLIQALERYHYDPRRPESLDPVKDGPDHACDALRYLVVNLDSAFTTSVVNY